MITLVVQAKWILFSLMIHMALVYCFIERKKEHVVHQRTPFIELQESPLKKKSEEGVSGVQKSVSSPKTSSMIVPTAEVQTALRTPVYAMSESAPNGGLTVGPVASEGLDNAQMLAVNLELEKPMQAIWRQIRAHIHYHADFFIEGIEGMVRADILVRPGGGLLALVSIEGQQDLVEWVKVALYNSLGRDFLKVNMTKKTLLHLFFRFVIVPVPPSIQEFVFSQTKLNFDILGYKEPVLNAPSDVYNVLKGGKGYRVSERNFTKQLEPYKHSCLIGKNKWGCEKAIDMLSKMGLHQDANPLKQQLKYLSNKNTESDSQ